MRPPKRRAVKPQLVCPCCQKTFLRQKFNQRYCSDVCRVTAWRARKKPSDVPGLLEEL